MAKSKAFVGVTADTTEASAFTGFLSTLSAQIKSDVNMAPVLDYAHSAMSDKFDAYMSAIAPTAPSQFHHVYDWGRIGMPQHQLWKNVIRGRGANKYVSFEFRASVLPVPLPEGDKVPFRRKHRFIYKAMIMEYNIGVTITPRRAKMLAFPVDDGRVIFTKGPVFVENPGGMGTTGAFTAAWSNWWGGPGANEAFNGEVRKALEDDMSEGSMRRFFRRFKKASFRRGTLSVTDSRTAFSDGSRLAQEFLQERNRKNEGRRKK
ncbi:hypothetical protein SEA_WOFFORD_55 [Streptomyces phage Wofford]|uniref:Uncharacterized protein n=1 Tax=Streptomyces phage Wofford TaxID=2283267 RepID=A0A345M9T0_9CAUD|nr:hypothetical protein HWB78_gp219 [Streptomyces phage Wollford]AXH67251.1 hypothetical protein SEA_WOFFORD_55 [Streptomyces phage Wollford]